LDATPSTKISTTGRDDPVLHPENNARSAVYLFDLKVDRYFGSGPLAERAFTGTNPLQCCQRKWNFLSQDRQFLVNWAHTGNLVLDRQLLLRHNQERKLALKSVPVSGYTVTATDLVRVAISSK
jgi:hypothetical protein